jgi:hypothetical protein
MRALVDTGAPVTFFDRGAADAIGIRMGYAGARRGHVVALGNRWEVQWELVTLSVPADADLCWEVDIAFAVSEELQMPFQGVLGSRGFLDRVVVSFNEYHNYFVIEKPDDFHDRVGRHLVDDPLTRSDVGWRHDTK